MSRVDLHRIAIVRPFARFLEETGASVIGAFRQDGLPYLALDRPEYFVPSKNFWSFVNKAAKREGIENLGFLVGQKYAADCAFPGFSNVLGGMPSLSLALDEACRLVNSSTSRSRIWLASAQRDDKVLLCHRTTFGASHPANQQIEWFGLMGMLGMVRLFTGLAWQPMEIGLTNPHRPSRLICDDLPDVRMRGVQPNAYIKFDRILLSLPPSTESASRSSEIDPEPVAIDCVGTVRQMLCAYVGEKHLSLESVAELCEMSKRTLQRKLSRLGCSYTELLDQARFEVASQLLKDPDGTVRDIAYQVGYDDPAHFSRAFRRIAGFYPQAYRKAYLSS